MRLFDKIVEPMLLIEKSKPFDSKDFLYEIKFDGMRALIYVSKTTFKIYNRHQKDITNLYPELKKIQEIITKPVIFDGEITCFKNGVPNFQELQKRIHLKNQNKIKNASIQNPVVFICFDILYENQNLMKKKLIERKQILKKYQDTDEFIKTSYILEKGKDFYKKIKKLNLEGIVAKRIDSLYEISNRSENWIKIKNIKVDSFVIGGYKEGKSTSMFSVCLGKIKDKKILYVGKVSIPRKSGLLELLKKEYKLQNSIFSNYTNNDWMYINPKYVCNVEYLEKSKKGILRHPVFRGFEKN